MTSTGRPPVASPPPEPPGADPSVQEWFARRTFCDPEPCTDELGARKAESGLAVSVVVPTHDEVATVTDVVAAVRALEDVAVDEVVVVDSASTDGTAARAAAAGATVHNGAELDQGLGPILGKGDALWRSLSAATGDVIVFIDGDIANPHPRFVASLLAPLLSDPNLAMVKGFYERPVGHQPDGQPTGGGRVTELTARPLLNCWWPQLAGLIQPLSGEYAARRELLEALPFFAGYGVELGLLIDTLETAGLDAIAQADLVERVHSSQSVHALSRMAFSLTQVAAKRLGALPDTPASLGYTQFQRDGDGVALESAGVPLVERPPRRAMTV